MRRSFSTVSGALIRKQSEMQIAVLEMTVRKPSFDNFNNSNTEYTAAYLGLIFSFDREFERNSITFKLVDENDGQQRCLCSLYVDDIDWVCLTLYTLVILAKLR